MSELSRRRALHALAAASATALTGCAGESGTETERPPVRREPITDVTATFVRRSDQRALYRRVEDENETSEANEMSEGAGTERENPRVAPEFVLLRDETDREKIAFRDGPAVAELESFLAETDPAEHTVYLAQSPVSQCHTVHLAGMYRREDGVTASFCQQLRPADVSCSTDERDVFGAAVRIPAVAADYTSVGARWGTNCPPNLLARNDEDSRESSTATTTRSDATTTHSDHSTAGGDGDV
jgi:hypothetical protein